MLAPIDIVFDSKQVGTANVTGTSDYPIYTLQPGIENCVGVALTYVSVPFTYYVLDSTCNTFVLQDSAATLYTCSIVAGTYNSVNLIAQLSDALVRASVPSPTNYNFFVDTTTGKLTVYNSTAVFTIRFDGAASSSSCHETLGFAASSVTLATSQTFRDNAENIITANVLVAPRVVNLTGPMQMFLNSDFGSSIYGSVRNQTSVQPLVGFWPVNSNYQGTIELMRDYPVMIPMSKTTLTKIGLWLTIGNRTRYNGGSTDTAYLPLNGEPFQVGLRFFVRVEDEQQSQDSMGNGTTRVTESSRSSVYKPATSRQLRKQF